MTGRHVTILERPSLKEARMVLGFTGWMDGGELSIGTVDFLTARLGAVRLAEIDPAPFYLYSFPGSMDTSALFRPHVRIENGLVRDVDEPFSTFTCSPEHHVILFTAREPNLRWREYAESVFSVACEFNVTQACFVGSVAGLVPHSRDPRIFCSVSEKSMLPLLEKYDLVPSEYEGPGSFVSYMTPLARQYGIEFMSLVAEIPAYVQGKNPRCIAAMVRKLSTILDLPIDTSDLNDESREFEKRLNETIRLQPGLADQIRSIERDFDRQSSENREDELKAWLDRQGIRLE